MLTQVTAVKKDSFEDQEWLRCFFCGGLSCPKEDYRQNLFNNAIEGLHSNWINDHILAMQRPSTLIMNVFGLVKQFKEHNIGAILNLQKPGEHSKCGPGLQQQSGFSYLPSDFQKVGIQFFNYHCPDMETPTYEDIFRIIDVFYNAIKVNHKKVAVHCHAGTGRTLVAICSWLIYINRSSAQDIIQYVKTRRQGVLSRQSQKDFLKQLAFNLQTHRKNLKNGSLSYDEVVRRTYELTVGPARLRCKQIALIAEQAIESLKASLREGRVESSQFLIGLIQPENEHLEGQRWSEQLQEKCKAIYIIKYGNLQFDLLTSHTHHLVLTHTLLGFFQNLQQPVFSLKDLLLLTQLAKSKTNIHDLLTNVKLLHQLDRYKSKLLLQILCLLGLTRRADQKLLSEAIYKILFYLSKQKKNHQNLFRGNKLLSNAILGFEGPPLVQAFIRWSQQLPQKQSQLKFLQYEMLQLCVNIKYELKRSKGEPNEKQLCEILWRAKKPIMALM